MRRSANTVPPFCDEPVQFECSITAWLWKIVSPLLFTIGTFGNILSIIVLTRKQLRSQPATILLLFLACSDLTMLMCSLTRQFMLPFNIDIKNLSNFNCIAHGWVTYTAAAYSVWILVLLTIERFIVIVWPFWGRENITGRVSITAAIGLLIVLACSTAPWLFMFELKTVSVNISTLNETHTSVENITVCLGRTEQYQGYKNGAWRVVILVFLTIMPMLIIITGNIFIAITLCLKKRKVHPEPVPSNIQCDKQHSPVKLLFFLCAFFLCTSLPYSLFGVIKSALFKDVTDMQVQARLQLAKGIVNILLYFNYAFNFLFYVYSGTRFKNELKNVMGEIRRHMSAFVERCACTIGQQNNDRNVVNVE